MWKLIRRDAITVWSNETVATRLARYRSIIELQRPARFLVARRVDVEFDPTADLKTLWQLHEKNRDTFQKLLKSIDEGATKLEEIPIPEHSFLELKATLADRIMQNCHFCERRCHVDRRVQTGFCGVPSETYVSSAFLHTGEEAPLVPSGTIFFSGCNFRCAHCQNFDISYNPTNGVPVTGKQLAKIADKLAGEGARNINYVGGDPTPNIHTIISSLVYQEYNITQLWNSNMYLTQEAMELLLDIIDFWLPDLKYFSDECARRISSVEEYTEVVTRNISRAYYEGTKEMIIRVLVLPNHLDCCVKPILEWIARNTPEALVNVMSQYRPQWRVLRNPEEFSDITRRVTSEEMRQAYAIAEDLGLEFRSVS